MAELRISLSASPTSSPRPATPEAISKSSVNSWKCKSTSSKNRKESGRFHSTALTTDQAKHCRNSPDESGTLQRHRVDDRPLRSGNRKQVGEGSLQRCRRRNSMRLEPFARF